MHKKLERMVKGLGHASLEALITWFPGNTKEELVKEVEKSEILEVEGNIVYLKSGITPSEKKVLNKEISFVHALSEKNNVINTNNNAIKELPPGKTQEVACERYLDIKTKDIAVQESLSYSRVLELIYEYNRMIQQEYLELTCNSYENFKNAVVFYYEQRYDVVFMEGSFEDVEMFSLFHRKNKVQVANLLLTKYLSDDIVGFLEETFSEDTVYICAYEIFGEVPKFSSFEFYVKNGEEILQEYKERFKLVKENCPLLKIDSN